MIAKIMFAGDLHKKIIDPVTIEGYRACNTAVQKALMQVIQEEGITHFCSLGDWYDRGFSTDNASAIPEYDMDLEMYRILKGKFYGLIGNHIKLGLDSNPELFLIQPHDFYKPRYSIYRDYQIIKTPNVLNFDSVQISFMHHNGNRKTLEGYRAHRQDGTTYHIALYHTPWIIPNQQLVRAGLSANTFTNTAIGDCLEGVDLAICGDIHDPIGRFVINHQHGETTMIVPGSLTNTTSAANHRHAAIYIPIVTIEDDSKVSLSFKMFDLKVNMLRFKDAEHKRKQEEKLEGIKSRRKGDSSIEGEVRSVFNLDAPDAYSLDNFIRRMRYTAEETAMIRSIMQNPLDVDSLIKIYTETEPEI